MACAPDANFSSEDARFKSLMDGETVEVVDNDEFIDSLDQPNAGSQDDDGSSDTMGDNSTGPTGSTGTTTGGDGSTGTDDGSTNGYNGNGASGRENAGNDDKNENRGKPEGQSCKERLVGQDKENKHDEMITSPDEMAEDNDMYNAIRCGKKDHKVLVCHIPNADPEKRKTLCIGRPALEAHLRHLGAKRGSEHVDYAGPCKDEAEKESKSEDEEEEKFNDDMELFEI